MAVKQTAGREPARNVCAEVLTHAAFYAGWPKAWAAFNMAKEVWAEEAAPEDAMAAHAASMVFPIGAPNDAYAAYFTGKSYLAPVSSSQVGIYNVTFEPGCRNNLAHPPRENRRRADSCLRGRKRLLSGSGQARAAARPRRCCKHSARGQTLARRRTGQLVLASGSRGSRHGNVQRVV